jgi:hypothetical protein
MILLRLFQESKNIIFTCGDSKNHSWSSPLVIYNIKKYLIRVSFQFGRGRIIIEGILAV